MFSLVKAHRALKCSVVMNQFMRPCVKLPRLGPSIVQSRNTSGASFEDIKVVSNPDGEVSIQEPARDGSFTTKQAGSNERDEFWRKIPVWEGVDAENFLSYRWTVSFDIRSYTRISMCAKTRNVLQIANLVQGPEKLHKFLVSVLPEDIPLDSGGGQTQPRDAFIADVFAGVSAATMAVRMTYGLVCSKKMMLIELLILD